MSQKLLVIDDDAGMAKVIGLTAQQLGLEFAAVDDPRIAVERFVDFRPDIVIIDMIMPGKDGIDVLNEILASNVPAKIVLTSGYGSTYMRLAQGVARIHDAGPFTCLQKPFRRQELIDVIRELASDTASCPPPSVHAHGQQATGRGAEPPCN